MKRFVRSFLISSFLLANFLGNTQTSNKNAFTLKDLYPSLLVSEAQISPSGNWVIYVESTTSESTVKLLAPQTQDSKSIEFSGPVGSISDLRWLSDEHVVIVQKNEKFSGHNLFVYSITTSELTALSKPEWASTLLSASAGDNARVTFSSVDLESGLFLVFTSTAPFTNAEAVYKAEKQFTSVVVDENGLPIAALSQEGKSSLLHYSSKGEALLSLNFSISPESMIVPLAPHPNGQWLYASSTVGRENFALVVYDPKEQVEREVLLQVPSVDLLHLALDNEGRPYFAEYFSSVGIQQHCFSASLKREFAQMNGIIESAFRIENTTSNGELLLVSTQSQIRNTSFVLFHKPEQRATFLFGAKKEDRFEKRKFSKQIAVSYELPRGGQSNVLFCFNNAPIHPDKIVVVLNESANSPWEQNFQPGLQLLASRGVHVLAINAPGTVGRGQSVMSGQGMTDVAFFNASVESAIAAVNKELGLNLSNVTYAAFGGQAERLRQMASTGELKKAKLFLGLTATPLLLQSSGDFSSYASLLSAISVQKKEDDKSLPATTMIARCMYSPELKTPSAAEGAAWTLLPATNSEQLLLMEEMIQSLFLFAATK
jgi:hypothetical protein